MNEDKGLNEEDVRGGIRLVRGAALMVVSAASALITITIFALGNTIYLPLVFSPEGVTPTPKPEPGAVEILENYTFFTTLLGNLHIVGEVMNGTDEDISLVSVSANLYSGNGELLETESALLYLSNLPAGEKSCFDLTFYFPNEDWFTLEFEKPTYLEIGYPLPELTVMNDSGFYGSLTGMYQILGEVRNDHGSTVYTVEPVGTLYNEGGAVIGCDFTLVNLINLEPGQKSAFELIYLGRDYEDVYDYRIQVGGVAE